MPYVTKHHPNEKGKSHYVKGSGVYLFMRRHAVSVNDLLRDLKHAVGIELAWKHLISLLNIEN